MEQQSRRIMLQTNVTDTKKRIDDLVLQFNEWMKKRESPTSISLHFSTSEEHPLTISEIAHFLHSTTDALDGCNVEWSSETDATLNLQIKVETTYNKE